jgi:hypothetical protein
MNPSELLLTAKNIAENHVTSGSDLNDAITKVASEQNLSKSQIERLVEETNKATFLDLLEKKGEQEFPIANYDTIKSLLAPKIEKKASTGLNFNNLEYSEANFKDSLGTDHITQPIQKIAEEQSFNEDELAYLAALVKVGNEFTENYNRFMDLEALGQKRYGYKHKDAADLIKVAEIHKDNEILALDSLDKELEKQAAIYEVILEKCATFGPLGKGIAKMWWGNTNPLKATSTRGIIGAGINNITKLVVGGAGNGVVGVGKAALGTAAYTLPVIAPLAARTSLNTAFTTVEQGGKAIKGTRQALTSHNFIGPGFENVASELNKTAGVGDFAANAVTGAKTLFKNPLVKGIGGAALSTVGTLADAFKNVTGTIGTKVASDVTKEAGFMEGLQQALEFITPAVVYNATPGGMLGGIAAAAAKKLGGGIALTMNRKEFDSSFDTIMKNNPDLAENKKQVRGYFDVVSRHAPSLAKDPLVAESIVKNMNAFGGVDYNTVRGLRETESLNSSGPSEKGLSGLTPMFGRS